MPTARISPPTGGTELDTASKDFSLVLGGPLFQLLRRAHLSDDALLLVRQRVVVFAALTWLPLLLLTAAEGTLLGNVPVPFLLDVEAYTRYLVALPLLILAELLVHQRMRPLASMFLERRLIPEGGVARFEAAIASAFRLRNSTMAELALIAVVYVVGTLIVWRHYVALETSTWYGAQSPRGLTLSYAGIWHAYVSLPIFQFLLVRWYFRLFIWTRFLWQVSRIELALVPTHPDRVGGLGFLSNTVYAMVPLLTAHGALLAGVIGNRIFHLGATLPDFKLEVLTLVVFLMCIVLGPLLVFSPRLAEVKRRGLREYGRLVQRYDREFDGKWLRGGAGAAEPLLGSADIQSLADFANSFEVVRSMNLAPFTKGAILQLAAATVAPIVPLLLTMMPLEELLKLLFGVLF